MDSVIENDHVLDDYSEAAEIIVDSYLDGDAVQFDMYAEEEGSREVEQALGEELADNFARTSWNKNRAALGGLLATLGVTSLASTALTGSAAAGTLGMGTTYAGATLLEGAKEENKEGDIYEMLEGVDISEAPGEYTWQVEYLPEL